MLAPRKKSFKYQEEWNGKGLINNEGQKESFFVLKVIMKKLNKTMIDKE